MLFGGSVCWGAGSALGACVSAGRLVEGVFRFVEVFLFIEVDGFCFLVTPEEGFRLFAVSPCTVRGTAAKSLSALSDSSAFNKNAVKAVTPKRIK
jgi:hypothetical protein